MKPRSLTIACLIATAMSCPAYAQLDCPEAETTTEAERIYALSTLWHAVKQDFAWFHQVPDLDWDAEYRRHIPMVQAAESELDYFRALQSFIATVEDGHTGVYPSKSLKLGCVADTIAISLKDIGDEVYVTNVDASLVEDVPVGSRLLSVDGMDIDAKIARDVAPYIATSAPHVRRSYEVAGNNWQLVGPLVGAPGSTAELEIITPEGERKMVSVQRDRAMAERSDWVVETPGWPDKLAELTWDGDIAILSLNSFGDRAIRDEFDALWPDMAKAKGLVIDLTRNGGGSTGNGTYILKRFIDREAAGSAWMTPKRISAYVAWSGGSERFKDWKNPQWETGDHSTLEPLEPGERLVVPTAIVTSAGTASAAEDFMIFAKTQPHMVQVGTPTFGSTGQPISLQLPGGLAARVSVKRDTYPDGTDFVGTGVMPDIQVDKTLKDYLEGREPAMQAALKSVRDRIEESH